MKRIWLRRGTSASDDDIIRYLLEALPEEENLDADGRQQLEIANQLMAELFKRGVSLRRFDIESGLTGFPVYPEQPFMMKQPLMSGGIPVYYSLWLASKYSGHAARAVKNNLVFLKERTGCSANEYTIQLYIDIDTENPDFPVPIEGLTRFAQCMEFNLADADSMVNAINQACMRVAPHAHSKLRVGLGKFGPDEYKHFAKGSLFSSRIPFDMASEWLLFKNIHRRAGQFGWFWRLVARRRDRKDPD
jgi:hypothetical protein